MNASWLSPPSTWTIPFGVKRDGCIVSRVATERYAIPPPRPLRAYQSDTGDSATALTSLSRAYALSRALCKLRGSVGGEAVRDKMAHELAELGGGRLVDLRLGVRGEGWVGSGLGLGSGVGYYG